ncbi:MAG: hypothetical protein ABI240_06695 [Sphingomonas sp.]
MLEAGFDLGQRARERWQELVETLLKFDGVRDPRDVDAGQPVSPRRVGDRCEVFDIPRIAPTAELQGKYADGPLPGDEG